VGNMYNSLTAAKSIRSVRKERCCTSDLTLAIFPSPETRLLTACITTTDAILLTDGEICALIYATECPYKRVGPSACSL
jgi:hypothetical protein